jgi:hypothetical protein
LNTVRFGPFEADFRSGELRQSGIRIRIQERGLLTPARTVFYYVSISPGRTALRQVKYYNYGRKTIEDLMVLPRPVEWPALAVSPNETEIPATINDGYLSQVLLARDFR